MSVEEFFNSLLETFSISRCIVIFDFLRRETRMLFGKKDKSEAPVERKQRQLVELVGLLPAGIVRPPWKLKCVFSVGGLEAVGFDTGSEALLVASSNGQGIYDCATGNRIYRNREDSRYDWKSLSAQRLDRPHAAPIPMSGIHGGGLRLCTDDGWSLHTVYTAWPKAHLVLVPPDGSLWEIPGTRYQQDFDVVATETELRVYGFSWTGKTFVWSDEVDIRVYGRA